MQVLRNC